MPLALEFTEQASNAFGFGQREVSGLVLAVEEIYSGYLDQLHGSAGIDLVLDNEHYQLRLTIRFRMAHPKLRAFNLMWPMYSSLKRSTVVILPRCWVKY